MFNTNQTGDHPTESTSPLFKHSTESPENQHSNSEKFFDAHSDSPLEVLAQDYDDLKTVVGEYQVAAIANEVLIQSKSDTEFEIQAQEHEELKTSVEEHLVKQVANGVFRSVQCVIQISLSHFLYFIVTWTP